MSSALKHSIGPEHLERVGKSIRAAYADFPLESFKSIAVDLESLELKARVRRVSEAFRQNLPDNYPKALAVLLQSVEDQKIRGFDIWPHTDFVQRYGLGDFTLSLDALSVLTKLFTAEFAVRPFLKMYPREMLEYMIKLTSSSDVHHRRWASEGTRPRLPWGERLDNHVKNPGLTRPILDALKFDPELYVRKSVANHINDIAKDHPTYAIRLLRDWRKEAKSSEEKARLLWITKHSLRSLIKAGHAEALSAIGVKTKTAIRVMGFKLSKKVYKLGERMDFTIEIESQSDRMQIIVLDYAVHYQKANGKQNPKVFKWKTFQIKPREKVRLTKAHVLKNVTTRVHYAGAHSLAIQINGVVVKNLKWDLLL